MSEHLCKVKYLKRQYADLETKFDSIKIYRVGTVHMTKSLSEGIHPDLLPQLQSLRYVLLPDTLDAQVGKLHRHVLTVYIHGADALLAPIPAHAGRTDQVVGVGLGDV